jgi:hypothetical protein
MVCLVPPRFPVPTDRDAASATPSASASLVRQNFSLDCVKCRTAVQRDNDLSIYLTLMVKLP